MPTVGQTRAYLALTLVVALWGSYPAFAKLALRHLSPFMLVSLRTLLASAFLVALLFRRGWAEWRALAWPDGFPHTDARIHDPDADVAPLRP